MQDPQSYEARVAQEVERFADVEEIHDLPAIYHWWSIRHCLPLFQELGFEGLDEFWDDHVAAVCRRRAPEPARFVSIGAGNGDIELGIARRLSAAGIANLELVLLELNPHMLERARADAASSGLADRVTTVEADFNTWTADGEADVYFASHSLHHVVELEHLFDELKRSLRPGGVLLVNDMIGRNGHQRWPEAAVLVNRIWETLPERYRYNPIHQRVDDVYPDVDYSTEGFEGIRAQDILPLLLERFHPDDFVTFMNVIDPFVDRVHGRNFDPERPEDTHLIELISALDDATLDLGVVTPTHLVGSFRVEPCEPRFPRGRSPQLALRREPAPSELEHELERARAQYAELRGRKVVRAGLAAVELARRPFRRSGGGG